jgi:hypothetical protein
MSSSSPTVDLPLTFGVDVLSSPAPVVGLLGGCVSSATLDAHRALLNNAAGGLPLAVKETLSGSKQEARLWWRRKWPGIGSGVRVVQFAHLADDALATSALVRRKAGCPRSTYDAYTCHGVLRGCWLSRHAFDVPALVVLFVRWPSANESELARRIDAARSACKSRQGVRLALALLHDTPLSAVDADADRFAQLRKQADVDKDLTLHLHAPDFQRAGLDAAAWALFAARLDKWLAEHALNYYHEYARALKKPKQALHKQTQQRLAIRLGLKIGFLAEFRADLPAALKYYAQAYAAVSDWRTALAARTRGAIPLNVAQLLDDGAPPAGELADAAAKEALRDDEAAYIALLAALFLARCHLASQRADLAALAIRKEAAAIRAMPLPPNREYIGWARLAALHTAFAELLEQQDGVAAPPDAASAADLCHPAFHFGVAARYAEARRRFALAALKQAPLLTADKLHPLLQALVDADVHVRHGEQWISPQQLYVGQPAPLALPGSSATVVAGDGVMLRWAHVRALLHEHHYAQHRRVAVVMLTRQYKALRPSRRLKRAVALQLAERHNRLGEHAKARNYADEAAYDYRAEAWWALLAAALREAMRAVKAQAEFGAWLTYAIELLPACMAGDRAGTQRSLLTALENPAAAGFAPLEQPLASRIHYATPLRLFDVRVQFDEPSVRALAPVRVRVRICSLAPLPLRMARVAVQFNEARFDQELRDDRSAVDVDGAASPPALVDVAGATGDRPPQTDLLFLPGAARVFVFSFAAPPTPTELECLHVVMQLGALPTALTFRWSVLEWRFAVKQLAPERRAALLQLSPPFAERTTVSVLDHAPQATFAISCAPQALQGALHALRLVVTASGAALAAPQLSITYRSAKAGDDATPSGAAAQRGSDASASAAAAAAAAAASAAAAAAVAAAAAHAAALPGDADPLIDVQAPNGALLFADAHGREPLPWHSALCSSVAANGVFERTVYLLTAEPLQRGFVSASVTHSSASGFTSTCSAQSTLSVVEPLSASLLFFSSALAPLTASALPITGEVWVCVSLTSRAASETLRIAEVHLVGLAPLRVIGRAAHAASAVAAGAAVAGASDPFGALLPPGGEHCSWFRATFDGSSVRDDAGIDGLLSIEVDWRRCAVDSDGGGDALAVRWRSARFRVATEPGEFDASVLCPSVARVGETLPHTVLVRNCTALIQTFSLVVDSDVFAFAGDKFTTFQLLPGASRAIDHCLIPLRAGRHALPSVQLTSVRHNRDLNVTRQKRLVFVEQAKLGDRVRIEPQADSGAE